MILDIITEPNEILRQTAQPLETREILGNKIQALINQMIITMRVKDGAGLAGNQIGKAIRIIVVSNEFDSKFNDDLVLINPVWKPKSFRKNWGEEGCLSLPHMFGEVKRYNKIKVSAQDRNGKAIDFLVDGITARIIQHEVDHLDGVLFTDKARKIHTFYEK